VVRLPDQPVHRVSDDPTPPRAGPVHTRQARNAIAPRIWGQGLFEGPQTNGHFVPYQWTDFVFSVAGEELGLVGAAGLIALFGLLFWRAYRIALHAEDLFGRCVGAGVIAWFGFQTFENIGIRTGSSGHRAAAAFVPTAGRACSRLDRDRPAQNIHKKPLRQTPRPTPALIMRGMAGRSLTVRVHLECRRSPGFATDGHGGAAALRKHRCAILRVVVRTPTAVVRPTMSMPDSSRCSFAVRSPRVTRWAQQSGRARSDRGSARFVAGARQARRSPGALPDFGRS